MTHPNFTPLTKGIVTETFTGFQRDPHQAAVELVARHFSADAPTRMEEAIEAVGYVEFHDLVQRRFLRIAIVDGDVNLVHVIPDPPDPAPRRARISFSPGLVVRTGTPSSRSYSLLGRVRRCPRSSKGVTSLPRAEVAPAPVRPCLGGRAGRPTLRRVSASRTG